MGRLRVRRPSRAKALPKDKRTRSLLSQGD